MRGLFLARIGGMRLTSIELSGFKSFAKKTALQFGSSITAIVGPNGSGKSNVAESFRFCLGEQSIKSMRGKRGEDLIWNGSGSSPRGAGDRIPSPAARGRGEMVEDAWGLTGYLYKREEAERKLQKTADNMREVGALRRELVPHLKFLSSQVKKIEDAQKLRNELAEKYVEYLSRENLYLKSARAELAEERGPQAERKELDARIAHLRGSLSKKHDAGTDELIKLETRGREAARERERILRELGGVEGELRAHARMAGEGGGALPVREARDFGERILHLAEGSQWTELLSLARAFLQKITQRSTHGDKGALEDKKRSLEAQLGKVGAAEDKTSAEVAALRRTIESEKDASRDAERELFAAMAHRAELETALAALRARDEVLAREEAQFKQELHEAAALLERMPEYEGSVVFEDEPRSAQEDRRRKLERLKIRLEEAGLMGSADILKEHKETALRDAFLERELQDLEKSAGSLKALIDDLTKTLETRFEDGINLINKEFNEYFKLMFGGGSASLQIVKEQKIKRMEEGSGEEEEFEVEEGIEITVALPHKRIKGLHMLSGGSAMVISIALIFAMSQVNPPPFLILDETDAALDEANSKRYGDMIENLSKKSQLILITHNRETMSRAGILYGITMGAD